MNRLPLAVVDIDPERSMPSARRSWRGALALLSCAALGFCPVGATASPAPEVSATTRPAALAPVLAAAASAADSGAVRIIARSVPDAAPVRAEPAFAITRATPAAVLADEAVLERQTAQDFDWTDGARQRDVPVRLYWPRSAKVAAAEGASALVPLVVFSHGIGGSRLGYSYFGKFLAAQGIASLHVQHIGSDRQLWTGNLLLLIFRLHTAAQEIEAIARVHDLHFALDQLMASPLGARIDKNRIVVAGHSYGANTAMLAVGAQLERGGKTVSFRDPRYTAAVLISAPPFYGESDAASILRSIDVPTLHVTSTEDVISIPGYSSGVEDRLAVFDAMGGRRKALAMFEGGSHSIFTDRVGTGGAELNPLVKSATRELALAFLQRTFDGDGTAMERWGERWKAILARYVRKD